MKLALALSLVLAAADARAYTKTEEYRVHRVRGWTVLIAPEVQARPDEENQALAFIDQKLGDIDRLVPRAAAAALRNVKIWVVWEHTDEASTYHPSAEWLRQHDYNPEKEHSVEVANLRHFLDWGRSDQPMILLHEMSHAYHNAVLGDGDARVLGAYQHALESGLKRAYALTNEREFFAELEKYDPQGFAMIESAWGVR